MITVNLDKMLWERHMKLSELSEKIGISMTNLSLLKTGKGRAIRFTTLNKICKVLDCLPGDILDYKPDPEGVEIEDDIYADFVDLHVDVDQGYKPVDEAARSLGLSVPKDPEPIDDFDAAYSQFDDTYDDMFDDAAGDEEDFFDDVYDDLDDFSNGSVDSVDDMFAPAPAQTQKPSGGGIPGVIDMDLFR